LVGSRCWRFAGCEPKVRKGRKDQIVKFSLVVYVTTIQPFEIILRVSSSEKGTANRGFYVSTVNGGLEWACAVTG